jgi:G3E family GTPase
VCRGSCSETLVTWSGIAAFTDLCHRAYGPALVRCKGLLAVDGEPGPVLLQGVNGVFGTERLARWPDEDRRSRLVCIFREEPKGFSQVLKLLQAQPGTLPPGSLNELDAG